MAMSSGGQGHGSIFTEINITPLTDIFLVLLIMMMVIAPTFNSSQKDIKAPKIHEGKAIEDSELTVEVLKDGQFFIDGKDVTNSLAAALQDKLPKLTSKHVVIKADEKTPSSTVMKVFEAASSTGYQKLTIAGEPLSQDRAAKLDTPEAE